MLIAGDIGGTKTGLAIYSDPHNPGRLCRETVRMLISILATEVGNLALKVLATGGIYITGGIALHVVGALRQPDFMQAFTRKGRFKDLMTRTPVHLITTQAALVGAPRPTGSTA